MSPANQSASPSRRSQILEAIFQAVESVNETLPPEANLARSESESVLGADSKLDSLGFVSLMVAVELRVHDKFGDCPSLAEELTSTATAGVVTLGTMADWLDARLS